MDKGVLASAETLIRVSPAEVWKALTDPDLIKHYLFGTQVESTWQVGDAIIYRGEWQGKSYEDKGRSSSWFPKSVLCRAIGALFPAFPMSPRTTRPSATNWSPRAIKPASP